MACCSLQLYQVLETKEASIGGALMGSSQQYRYPYLTLRPVAATARLKTVAMSVPQ
jgi:hypothetical protein